VTGGSWGGAA